MFSFNLGDRSVVILLTSILSVWLCPQPGPEGIPKRMPDPPFWTDGAQDGCRWDGEVGKPPRTSGAPKRPDGIPSALSAPPGLRGAKMAFQVDRTAGMLAGMFRRRINVMRTCTPL